MDKKVTEVTKLLLADVTDKGDVKALKALLPEVIDYIVAKYPAVDISDEGYILPKLFVKVYCETKETDYVKVYNALVYWHLNGLPNYFLLNNGNISKEQMIVEFVKDYKNKLSLMKF
jgi:hypothetical protein